MSKRSYNQYCGLAQALDILGERWTFLIIRNLFLGPQRYKDLLDGLPGIGTNLLAARLKHLGREGIVSSRTLPPPAGSNVYELTELGKGLWPAVVSLARWGARLLGQPTSQQVFEAAWIVLLMRATFRSGAAAGVRETYEYRIEDAVFHARIDDSVAEIQQGPALNPDLVITCDRKTFVAVSSRWLSAKDALASRQVKLQGDPAAFVRAIDMFEAV